MPSGPVCLSREAQNWVWKGGEPRMKRWLAIVYTAFLIFVMGFFFWESRNTLDREMISIATIRRAKLESEIKPCIDFLKLMRLYGEQTYGAAESENAPEGFAYLTYQAESDSYTLDAAEASSERSRLGNLVGVGTIPQSGTARQTLLLALRYQPFFSQFLARTPQVIWVSYQSVGELLSVFPWRPSAQIRAEDALWQEADCRDAQVIPEDSTVWINGCLTEDPAQKVAICSVGVTQAGGKQGALSLSLTTEHLASLIQCAYPAYLIDEDGWVVASNQTAIDREKTYQATNLTRILAQELTDETETDGRSFRVRSVGAYLICLSTIQDTPWRLLVRTPKVYTVGQSVLNTLPIWGICLMLILARREIARRRRAEAALRDASLTDPMTGLRNRRFLDTVVTKEMEIADRYTQPLSVITLDLDLFKLINDRFGHPVGDEVLKEVATTIQQCLRKADTVVRQGGEEFMLLLPHTGLIGAYEVAEKIRRRISETRDSVAGYYTASFGVAERAHGEAYHDLYRRVDDALYLAKQNGRNRVVCSATPAQADPGTVALHWDNAWNSGVASIDAQHRALLCDTYQLVEMTISRPPQEQVQQFFSRMRGAMEAHFHHEEAILRKYRYPGLEEHRYSHQELIGKAVRLTEELKTGKIGMLDLVSFIIEEAILGHILRTDFQFFPFLSPTSGEAPMEADKENAANREAEPGKVTSERSADS